MYYLKTINFIDGTITVGDSVSGESDMDIELSILPETCKRVGGIRGVELADNGAIISMQTVTDMVATALAGDPDCIVRMPEEGTVIVKNLLTSVESPVNAYDTEFIQVLLGGAA